MNKADNLGEFMLNTPTKKAVYIKLISLSY